MDPDQARQYVGPDLDPICLTLRWYSWKNFSKKLSLKKTADDKKKNMKNFLSIQVLPTHLKDSHYLIEHICLLVSSVDNLYKQFGPRSGPTICPAWSRSNLFDTQMVFLKEFLEKVDFEKNQQTTIKSMKNYLSIKLILTVSPTHLKDLYYLIEHSCLLVSSANNLCKQIGPRSGPTICRAWSGSNLFDLQMVFLKEFFKKIDFEKNSRQH